MAVERDDEVVSEPLEMVIPPAAANIMTIDQTSWGDIGAGIALFVLLYTSTLSLSLVLGGDSTGEPTFATAGARVVATLGFIAVQQAAGLPSNAWLTRDSSSEEASNQALSSPVAAPIAGIVFFAAAAALGIAASSAAGLAWDTTLPAARALPPPGAAADLLIFAPLTEEIFFRGYLLSATKRTGAAGSPQRFAVSSVLFALWHLGAGDGGPLFFLALGAYLAALYENSAGSLPLCVGTHATYNGCVTLLRAWRAAA